MNSMIKAVPDFFKDEQNKHAKSILARAETLSIEREEEYIGGRCSPYEFPLFEIKHSEFD